MTSRKQRTENKRVTYLLAPKHQLIGVFYKVRISFMRYQYNGQQRFVWPRCTEPKDSCEASVHIRRTTRRHIPHTCNCHSSSDPLTILFCNTQPLTLSLSLSVSLSLAHSPSMYHLLYTRVYHSDGLLHLVTTYQPFHFLNVAATNTSLLKPIFASLWSVKTATTLRNSSYFRTSSDLLFILPQIAWHRYTYFIIYTTTAGSIWDTPSYVNTGMTWKWNMPCQFRRPDLCA